LNVADLIAGLQKMPPEAEVMVEWGGTLDQGASPVAGLRHERDQYDLDGNRLDGGTVYLDY
jgi:hypothetical protein